MVHIKVKRGLNIPIEGEPKGEPVLLKNPTEVAFNFNFSGFETVKFHMLVQPGDRVKIGQPLCEDREVIGRNYVSPASGVVQEIKRGEKRRLSAIVIKVDGQEEMVERAKIDLTDISRADLVQKLLEGGLFSHIRARPFYRLANPKIPPRSIFIKAIETGPFVPEAEMQIVGKEEEFSLGLEALAKLVDCPIHLVYKKGTASQPLLQAKHVIHHTVEGPHPAGNVSVHIQAIDPIKSLSDTVWTLNILGVLHLGSFIRHGKLALDRIVSVAGPAILPEKRAYLRARFGHPVRDIFEGRVAQGLVRYVSGDFLTGDAVELDDFVGFSHTTCGALFEPEKREFLPFMRLGADQYTATGAYLSHFLSWMKKKIPFTTSLHGQRRAFMDGLLYEKFMPLDILPLQLIRACLAEDYELAQQYGLLEVVPEDFALCEFVDPSKIELMDIIRTALRRYYKDQLG